MEASHTSLPRFRSDLVAQPIETEGQRFVDVTDPDSGHTFRFYEVEYFMASAMDGNRDVPALAAWALAELGVEPAKEELEVVIGTLKDLGYLETGEVQPRLASGDSPYMFPEYYDDADAKPEWSFHDQLSVELARRVSDVTQISVPSVPAQATSVEVPVPEVQPISQTAPTPAPSIEPTPSSDTDRPSVDLPPPPEIAPVAAFTETPAVEPEFDMASTGQLPAVNAPAPAIATPTASFDDPLDAPLSEPVVEDNESTIITDFSGVPETAAGSDDSQPTDVHSPISESFREPSQQIIVPPDAHPEVVSPEEILTEESPVSEFAYEDEDVGADVSVDLSAHLPVDAKEVKEAVRQSKSLRNARKAPPPSLFDDVGGGSDHNIPISMAKTMPAPISSPASSPASAATSSQKSSQKRPRPVELPHAPDVVNPKPIGNDYASQRPSNIVVPIVVIVGVLGILGMLYWYFTTSPTTTGKLLPKTPAQIPAVVVGKTVETPKKPDQLVATLAVSKGIRARAVTMPVAGTVTWLVRDGALVDKGTILAQLRGAAEARYALEHNKSRLEHYQRLRAQALAKLAQAQPGSAMRRLRASAAAFERSVREKQQNIDEATQRLERRTIKSPISGVAERIVAPGRHRVATELVKVVEPPSLVATFSGSKASALHKGHSVVVKSLQDSDARIRCTVTDVIAGTSALVVCPTDRGFESGQQVVLSQQQQD